MKPEQPECLTPSLSGTSGPRRVSCSRSRLAAVSVKVTAMGCTPDSFDPKLTRSSPVVNIVRYRNHIGRSRCAVRGRHINRIGNRFQRASPISNRAAEQVIRFGGTRLCHCESCQDVGRQLAIRPRLEIETVTDARTGESPCTYPITQSSSLARS